MEFKTELLPNAPSQRLGDGEPIPGGGEALQAADCLEVAELMRGLYLEISPNGGMWWRFEKRPCNLKKLQGLFVP